MRKILAWMVLAVAVPLASMVAWIALDSGPASAPTVRPQLALQVPPTARPETRALLVASWPRVRAVCPDLDRHAASLEQVRQCPDLRLPLE